MNTEIPDRVAGVLIGLAAGDRNGGPIQMAVRLTESLIERGGFDRYDIGERYLSWWNEGAIDTGPTSARGFDLVNSGMTFDEAAKKTHDEFGGHTAGCNPAHRAAPLAMMDLPLDQLANYAISEAQLTHYHPLAGDVSAAVVVLCRSLIIGQDWKVALKKTQIDRLPETCDALKGQPDSYFILGGFAPDVLAAAIHFVSSNSDFDSALEKSIRFAGPENYCPVLVGSIGGARWGSKSIGSLMLSHCSLLQRVREITYGLAETWS